MKNQTLASIGIFLVIIAAATIIALSTSKKPIADNQEPAQQTNNTNNDPEVIEPPTSTTDVLSNGWKLYKNPALGFSLELPPDVSVDREFNSRTNRLTTFKGETLSFAVSLEEGKGRSLDLDGHYYLDFPSVGPSSLGGESARVFEAPKGYCDGPGCGDPFIAYLAKMGDDFYILKFFGDTTLNQDEKKVLSSFKFIK